MERENPEAMLEPEELALVQAGARALRCDVCLAASKVGVQRAKKGKALLDETALSSIVQLLCYGTPPDSLHEYPKYPGNPPLWGELYSVQRPAKGGGGEGGIGGGEGGGEGGSGGGEGGSGEGGSGGGAAGGRGAGGWRLTKRPKGSKPEERGGSTMQYNELVVKHAVISRACKHVILEPDADVDEHDGAVDRPDLAQTIYVHSAETAEQIAARYCRPFCGARAGSKEEL